jgi:hypothetical protein
LRCDLIEAATSSSQFWLSSRASLGPFEIV